MTADIINGLFESLGGFFVLPSILQLYKDKEVKGVSWLHVGFFTLWGVWNIYFYAYLLLWLSWAGGIVLTAANGYYLFLLLYYKKYPKVQPASRNGLKCLEETVKDIENHIQYFHTNEKDVGVASTSPQSNKCIDPDCVLCEMKVKEANARQ